MIFVVPLYEIDLPNDTLSEKVEGGIILFPLLTNFLSFDVISVVFILLTFLISNSILLFFIVTKENGLGYLLVAFVSFLSILVLIMNLFINNIKIIPYNSINKIESVLLAQNISYEENYMMEKDYKLVYLYGMLEDDSQIDNMLEEHSPGQVFVSEDKTNNMTVYYAVNGFHEPSDLKKIGTVAQDKKNVMKSLLRDRN